MATKLPKGEFPSGTRADEFQCFGPAATKDGDFNGIMLVDMGCFNQEGVDSNKMYHASVCQHKPTGKWYTYFEWGRTGAKNPQFQFVECRSKEEAQEELADQCHSKNDKRGEWATIGGIKTLRAKSGKDCYLVRPQAKRSTGLPDARTITEVSTTRTVSTSTVSRSGPKIDQHTLSLMRDLNMGVVNYTRSSMSDSALPTQGAIDNSRILIGEAKKRLTHIGDNITDHVADRELKAMTATLYGWIPKIKPLRIAAEKWILNADNIAAWELDLDAFESALSATPVQADSDPFAGFDVRMEYLERESKTGGFIRETLPRMSNFRNNYGQMKIHNVWKVDHHKAEDKFRSSIKKVGKVNSRETPLFQRERQDLSGDDVNIYKSTHTCLLIHGSRSVNISSILKSRLRMPKSLVGVVINGALLGPGIYMADDWQKSAGYCSLSKARWSGGSGSVSGRRAFMFLADVILGNVHLARETYGYTSPPRDYNSVMGKGGITSGSYGNLLNNEFTVYDVFQQQLRYLVEFDCQ